MTTFKRNHKQQIHAFANNAIENTVAFNETNERINDYTRDPRNKGPQE